MNWKDKCRDFFVKKVLGDIKESANDISVCTDSYLSPHSYASVRRMNIQVDALVYNVELLERIERLLDTLHDEWEKAVIDLRAIIKHTETQTNFHKETPIVESARMIYNSEWRGDEEADNG